MFARTDLALERHEMAGGVNIDGVSCEERQLGCARVTEMRVGTTAGARTVGKPIGRYVTVEVPPFTDNSFFLDERMDVLSEEIKKMLPNEGTVLVAGLGNRAITADALGPETASLIFATRHIDGETARSAGLSGLRAVASLQTGVLGETGMESAEVIGGIVKTIKPSAVIAVDALASRSIKRLGCTVQLSDTGICPGSGVGNTRAEISEKTLGVPVISLGVPTVVDALTLVCDFMQCDDEDSEKLRSIIEPRGERMTVTPREIDLLTERAAKYVAMSINHALHPQIDVQDILSLVCE